MTKYFWKHYYKAVTFLISKIAEYLPPVLQKQVKAYADKSYNNWLKENGFDFNEESLQVKIKYAPPISLSKEMNEETKKLDTDWNKLYKHVNRTRNFDKGFVLSAHYRYPAPEIDYSVSFMSRNMNKRTIQETMANVANQLEQKNN